MWGGPYKIRIMIFWGLYWGPLFRETTISGLKVPSDSENANSSKTDRALA